MSNNKHTQVVDFSNPNADKITSASTQAPMTNNKQQTAVEYYRKNILKITKLLVTGEITGDEWDLLEIKLTEEAEEIHKQQMTVFPLSVMGRYRNGDVLAEVAIDLYEQTFWGNNEQR